MRAYVVVLLGTLLAAPTALPQGKRAPASFDRIVPEQNPGGARFSPISAHVQSLLTPKVGNGAPADTARWRASFWAKVGGGICSATMIGPDTLLTAKHCIANGAEVVIDLPEGVVGDAEGKARGPCRHMKSDDPVDFSPDWALCRVKPPLRGDNIYFEYISTDPSKTAKGIRLLATGYGCVSLEKQLPDAKNPPEAEKPRIFRTGALFVDRPATEGQQYPNWVFTTRATPTSGAFICPGDSGGGVYWVSPSGARFIVAVASGVQSNPQASNYLTSYAAALHTSAAVELLKEWISGGARICGYGIAPDGCRPTP